MAWGNSDDCKVLMVHGIRDNASSFNNLIPLLPKGFYYLSIDLPGHGKSTHYAKGIQLTVMTYVISMKQIVDAIKWDKFHFIGHSFGGYIGEYFAGTCPKMVTKLVVIDAMPFCYEEDKIADEISKYQAYFSQLQHRLSSGNRPTYSYKEAVDRHIKYRPSKISHENAEKILLRSLVKCSNGGYQYSTDQRLKLDCNVFYTPLQNKSFIDKILCPKLIIMAKETYDHSEIARRNFHLMFSDASDYKLKVIEGNHNVHIDFAERVAPFISEFLCFKSSGL